MDASYGSISEKILLDITVLFWESNGAYSNRVHCFYCFWLRSSRRLSRRQSNQSLAKSGHVQLTGWSAQQQQKLCASLLLLPVPASTRLSTSVPTYRCDMYVIVTVAAVSRSTSPDSASGGAYGKRAIRLRRVPDGYTVQYDTNGRALSKFGPV